MYALRSFSFAFMTVVALCGAAPALAHKGAHHHHGRLSEDAIKAAAPKALTELIEKGKLEPTWKDAVLHGAERKKLDGQKVWRVRFDHPKPVDAAQGRFFLFFTSKGELVGANHTGE